MPVSGYETEEILEMVWRELPAGGRGRLWLFPDSAPARELRRLRVRLALEGY